MLRHYPTRIEVGQTDKDELEERRKKAEKPAPYEHLTLDRDTVGKSARLGLPLPPRHGSGAGGAGSTSF